MVRILIADDHELLRHGVRQLLEAQPDWKVVAEVNNGLDAVWLATQLQPDVAILDLSMPEMNGLVAARQIANHTPRTATLIFTMHHSGQLDREIFGSGASGYVLKSEAAEGLVDAVKAVKSGRPGYPDLAESCPRPRRTGCVAGLSPRENDILRRLAAGNSTKEIAYDLGISVKTVETHRSHLMGKLNLSSLCELIHFAVRHELVDPGALASSPQSQSAVA